MHWMLRLLPQAAQKTVLELCNIAEVPVQGLQLFPSTRYSTRTTQSTQTCLGSALGQGVESIFFFLEIQKQVKDKILVGECIKQNSYEL